MCVFSSYYIPTLLLQPNSPAQTTVCIVQLVIFHLLFWLTFLYPIFPVN